MAPESDFPLFPLGMAALPTEGVPLHIFEERYRIMIGECLENEAEFGIVWSDDDGMREVGCAMRIAELLDTDEEGRMNIACVGTRPFELIDMTASEPYPAGTIEFLADEAEELDDDVARAARDAYSALVVRATDEEPDAEGLRTMSAYSMAARIDFGPAAKQALLALRSENARLRLVAQLTRAVLKRLDFSDVAQERSRSNGKVRFG